MNIEMITGFIRHILTFGGGYMVTNGMVAADDVESGVGAIVTLLGLIWSFVAKQKSNDIV